MTPAALKRACAKATEKNKPDWQQQIQRDPERAYATNGERMHVLYEPTSLETRSSHWKICEELFQRVMKLHDRRADSHLIPDEYLGDLRDAIQRNRNRFNLQSGEALQPGFPRLPGLTRDIGVDAQYLLDGLRFVGPFAELAFCGGPLDPILLISQDKRRHAIISPVRL